MPKEIKEPLEFFRSELLKRPKKPDYTRKFLRDHWRDLRLAIEECWKHQNDDPGAFPFLVTSAIMQSARRPKDAKEQLLTKREKMAD